MIDFVQFFNPSYLFNTQPGHIFPSYWIYLTFFGLLLIIGIIIFISLHIVKFSPPLKKILRPIPAHLQIFSIVGIFLVLFRLGGAYYLSMRVFYIIWLAVFIWYLIKLSQKVQKYPAELDKFLSKEENKKYSYLSHKKKNKKK